MADFADSFWVGVATVSFRIAGARGETRTRTTFRSTDFKSAQANKWQHSTTSDRSIHAGFKPFAFRELSSFVAII